jgi:signal transduction histidine kinase
VWEQFLNAAASTASAQSRSVILSSDGLYAIARCIVFLILLASGGLLVDTNMWPPRATLPALGLLIWIYGAFALAMIGSAFWRKVVITRAALVADVIFFSVLTYYNRTPHDLFYSLYIMPLVGASFQLRRTNALAVGLFAAFGYATGFILSFSLDPTRIVRNDTLGLLAMTLRCAVMVLIPWLSASLAERWSANNRQSIERAEHKQANALAEANAYRDRAHAMYEVAYALSTNPNDQSILDTTLAEGRKLMDYSCGAVLLATGNLDELFVAASLDLEATEKQQTITLGHGEISNSIREGMPFVIENLQLEPVFAPLPTLMQNRAACAIPLRSGKQNFGIMVVAAGSSAVFTDDRVEMLSALANYSLIALQNAHLINDLRNERTKLLSKEEEVRHQLARDLHDGPAQSLAAITMNVEFIKRMFERDPARVVPELDKLSTLAKRTTHEVRTMLFELRPLALETQGLGETLRQYFERFQDTAGNTQILLETGTLDVSLDTKTEGTLFNIIQEAVNNALKHARAQHIWVRVHHIGDQVETVIQDDGRGFDIQKVKATYDKRGSFGLLNIEERAQLVGGTAELQSTPGQGTTVRVVVPVR